LALAQRARDTDFALPASLLLISAWTDLEATGDSYDTGSDPFFTRELVRALGVFQMAAGAAGEFIHEQNRTTTPSELERCCDHCENPGSG
jgi:acetyl esterase/lipase